LSTKIWKFFIVKKNIVSKLIEKGVMSTSANKKKEKRKE